MERLTGTIYKKGYCNSKNGCELLDCGQCDHFETMIDRLAYYEELEEQGLLLRLPCKVGDTIYLVDFDENDYDVATIESIEIDKDGFTINSDYEIGTDLDAEYVCLTKEEAEQKLAEMKGE